MALTPRVNYLLLLIPSNGRGKALQQSRACFGKQLYGKVLKGGPPGGEVLNRTLNRHWSAGRAYQGVEVIVLKELGKMTP